MLQFLWCLLFISGLERTFAATSRPTLRPTFRPTLSPTFSPTNSPTGATKPPTHGPTHIPTAYPTMAPTIHLESNEDIKIQVKVSLQGSEVNNLCDDSNTDKYANSLVNVFVAASGVSDSDVESKKLADCADEGPSANLTYELRSKNARVQYTVPNRIDNGDFADTYESNLKLVFSTATLTNVVLVEASVAPSIKSSKNPFAGFFSGYFGLGVVILAVSTLWLVLLRAEEGGADDLRLKQLQEEKRKFELKYGPIEEESMDRTEKDILESVEMAEATEETSGETKETKKYNTGGQTQIGIEMQTQTQTQNQNKTQAPTQTQAQTQTQTQAPTQTQAQPEPQPQTQTEKENETTQNASNVQTDPSQYVYRASVVEEVKHVKNPEERESLDLDQIKDPGNKRRKTQEYLNNLWDDKADQKGPEKQEDDDE